MKFINLYTALKMSPMFLSLKSAKIYSNIFSRNCKPIKSWRPRLVPNTHWLLSHGEEFIMEGETTSLTYNILLGALWNWLSIVLSSSFNIVFNPYYPWLTCYQHDYVSYNYFMIHGTTNKKLDRKYFQKINLSCAGRQV